jgi:4-hydroxy-tetrahydrodipicolinate synthase
MGLNQLRGVVPAIVTPFDSNDSLNLKAADQLVTSLIDHGVHGIMTTGGTGEFPHLDRTERLELTRRVVEAVGGRVPVITGTAGCSTREVLFLCDDAAQAGANAVIVVPPYYFPLSEKAIASFFGTVADRSALPIFLYNNPLYTGNGMRPGLIADIIEHPRIVGLKQSSADLGELVEVIHEVRVVRGLSKSICTGIDSQLSAALAVGADGIFSTAACLVPQLMVSLFDLAASNDTAKAADLQMKLQPLNRFLEYDPGYVAPAKEGLGILGIDVGQPRHPLPSLTGDEIERLRAALTQLQMAAL